jgi:hypothetical protein
LALAIISWPGYAHPQRLRLADADADPDAAETVRASSSCPLRSAEVPGIMSP